MYAIPRYEKSSHRKYLDLIVDECHSVESRKLDCQETYRSKEPSTMVHCIRIVSFAGHFYRGRTHFFGV